MNSFNLLFSVLVLNGSFQQLLQTQLPFATASGSSIFLVLGWLPLVFSVLFFLIPAGRFFSMRALQRQQHEQNIRKRLFQVIFTRQGQAQTMSDILAALHVTDAQETLTAPIVEERLKELVLNMPGDMQVNDTAEVQFSFPRITRELQAAPQLRHLRQIDDSLGEIIVESDNQ